ncbi:ubiquitin-protein ligase E3 component [Aspergillus luchuensis]|uniref:Ubiquitin-protein ligase E3 component n=1 Tax=Aspergillus kawachii TaxID=1069201 RepID=A0A146FU37_ASPKA|nr:ubiquitin-protein ligase E3 component [Aspergillus luchuensis]
MSVEPMAEKTIPKDPNGSFRNHPAKQFIFCATKDGSSFKDRHSDHARQIAKEEFD